MLEAIPAGPNSGAAAELSGGTAAVGTTRVPKVSSIPSTTVVTSGLVVSPSTLADFDSIIGRLDKQGAIEENVHLRES